MFPPNINCLTPLTSNVPQWPLHWHHRWGPPALQKLKKLKNLSYCNIFYWQKQFQLKYVLHHQYFIFKSNTYRFSQQNMCDLVNILQSEQTLTNAYRLSKQKYVWRQKIKYLQTQQTPNPEAQDPELVPPDNMKYIF